MDMSAVVISMEIARRDAGSAMPHAPVRPHRDTRERVRAATRRVRRLLRR